MLIVCLDNDQNPTSKCALIEECYNVYMHYSFILLLDTSSSTKRGVCNKMNIYKVVNKQVCKIDVSFL